MSNRWIASVASVGLLAAPGVMKFAEVSAAHDAPEPAEHADAWCVGKDGADVERRLGGTKDVAAQLPSGAEVEMLETRGRSARIAYSWSGRPRVGWVDTATLVQCTEDTSGSSHGHGATVPGPSPGGAVGDLTETDGPTLHAHLIDVGQGAATLFEFSCGAMLVDTGGETNGEFSSADALQAYLDDFFDRRSDLNRTLDLLVITHPHIDHARNARLVAENYTVKNVVTDGRTDSSGGRQQKWLQDWAKRSARLETIDAVSVPAGGRTTSIVDPISCTDEDPKLRVLWGDVATKPPEWSAAAFKNANNKSVVLRVDFGKASFLVSGDLEEEGIEELLKKHRGTDAVDVDVWQVGHHGSHNATTKPLLDALTPEVALLATGDPSRQQSWTAWKYGHPRRPVVDLLSNAVSRERPPADELVAAAAMTFESGRITKAIYATGWDGSVVVTAKNDGTLAVRTER
jgi:competence protein ComEC